MYPGLFDKRAQGEYGKLDAYMLEWLHTPSTLSFSRNGGNDFRFRVFVHSHRVIEPFFTVRPITFLIKKYVDV